MEVTFLFTGLWGRHPHSTEQFQRPAIVIKLLQFSVGHRSQHQQVLHQPQLLRHQAHVESGAEEELILLVRLWRFRRKQIHRRLHGKNYAGKFKKTIGRQSGLAVSKLNSRSKGNGFKSGLIQITRWKWGESHARIYSCTQFWFIVEKIRKIQVAKYMGHTKKIFFLKFKNKVCKNCHCKSTIGPRHTRYFLHSILRWKEPRFSIDQGKLLTKHNSKYFYELNLVGIEPQYCVEKYLIR